MAVDPSRMTLEQRQQWWATLTPEQRAGWRAKAQKARQAAVQVAEAAVPAEQRPALRREVPKQFAGVTGVEVLDGAAASAAARRIRDRETALAADAPDYEDWTIG